MAQIDILSYLTQIIWLTVIIGTFYIILLRRVLPEIKKILKVRKLMKIVEIEMKSKETEESKIIINTLNISNNDIRERSNINNKLIIENLKIKNQVNLIEANKAYLNSVAKLLIER